MQTGLHLSHLERIRQDLLFLAGRLPHRGAQSESEREAANFIRDRLKPFIPDLEMQQFVGVDNYLWLFASFYSEFLVVAILATWWPPVAFLYGCVAFCGYMAEFHGYRIFSRLMPHYESQNVIAQHLAPKPRIRVILTAHYDSGCATPLSKPAFMPWRRRAHWLILGSMMLVLATCALDSLAMFQGEEYLFTAPVRWVCVALLVSFAVALFYAATQAEDIRGANVNASGVAALLQCAEEIAANPPENVDITFLATGSHEAWMSGMAHFLAQESLERDRTFFINLEGVGAGKLHYIEREGMLLATPSSPVLCKAAERLAERHALKPAQLSAIVSEAHLPLSRGFHALSIMGLNEAGYPPHWNWHSDRFTEVDERLIAQSSAFACDLVEELSKAWERGEGNHELQGEEGGE